MRSSAAEPRTRALDHADEEYTAGSHGRKSLAVETPDTLLQLLPSYSKGTSAGQHEDINDPAQVYDCLRRQMDNWSSHRPGPCSAARHDDNDRRRRPAVSVRRWR